MSCLHGNHEDNCDNCDEEIRQWTMGYESQLKELCALKEEREALKKENAAFKAVMQQALDVLERVDCVDGYCDILSLSLCEAVEESIASLRKAIAQPVEPAEKAKLQWGQFVGCDLPTPAAFGPVAHCQRDQPFFSAQQMNDCVAADRVQRQAAQPTAERNFCPRCGKRLGGTDDIHTCTAPVDPKETK